MDTTFLIVRMCLVGYGCYLISQGNLTLAAVLIGVYWIILESIQVQIARMAALMGLASLALYRLIARRR